ncbi:MAG: hypothetical protein CfP315_0839 [Candidatus Improbicoccus pseudotrichonymphae]|uniref:Uncharacterized protein n=1 Tax=Candidatus Improbicoccus pseudotrichonymphae TaxID=3033792 RepID=A0AA48KXB5_9FIRM|nr:MAG: hypothetical protein CfP315_0839 [Candidatus Improbicoccus pseudotrichonymphae]
MSISKKIYSLLLCLLFAFTLGFYDLVKSEANGKVIPVTLSGNIPFKVSYHDYGDANVSGEPIDVTFNLPVTIKIPLSVDAVNASKVKVSGNISAVANFAGLLPKDLAQAATDETKAMLNNKEISIAFDGEGAMSGSYGAVSISLIVRGNLINFLIGLARNGFNFSSVFSPAGITTRENSAVDDSFHVVVGSQGELGVTDNKAWFKTKENKVAVVPISEFVPYAGILDLSFGEVEITEDVSEVLDLLKNNSDNTENINYTFDQWSNGVRVRATENVFPEGSRLVAKKAEDNDEWYKKNIDNFSEVEHFLGYDIKVTDPYGKELQPNGKVEVWLEIPSHYDSVDQIHVNFVSEGKDEIFNDDKVEQHENKKYYVFQTTHFSPYAIVDELSASEKISNPKTGSALPCNLIIASLVSLSLMFVLGKKRKYRYVNHV